jgi:4-diphosphocytidyl-2-C-methyl-D-erythritol kinase
MSRVIVRTPAKINLALVVGPLRSDGFHELASVYQAVGLYDDVAAESAPDGVLTVTTTGPNAAEVPDGADNLAIRAARLLADRCGVSEGAHLQIHKGIPVAGGMAGGSSDAAAALVACDALWRTGLDRAELLGLAGELGSDVPFCVLGGTAVGSGHGELVSPALVRGTYSWVIALATNGMSTPQVYAELDKLRGDDPVASPKVPADLLAALRTGDVARLGQMLVNDLQPVAVRLRPTLARLLSEGVENGALGAMVSGSGPTCAFLARDGDHALDLAVRLSSTGLCSSVTTATGPVSGARVVSG